MKPRVLFVDDEPALLEGIEMMLYRQRQRWDMVFAGSGRQGLALAGQASTAVAVADMRMPEMDGIAFLRQLRESSPDTVRMMLTGNTDLGTAVAAVNAGNVFRFLTKPCEPDLLVSMLEAGVEQYRLVTAERELLTKTLSGSVRILTELLSMVDPIGFASALWLRDSVRTMAESLELPNPWEIVVAAMLSPIGFITLPPDLLARSVSGERLKVEEEKLVARVPEIGYGLLSKIPRLESVAAIVRYHDKRYDGSGPPEDAVRGEEIPVGARIIKIVGDLGRLSLEGHSRARLLRRMKERSGWYDPGLLDRIFPLFVPPVEEDAEYTPVSVEELRIGDKLRDSVRTLDGDLILASGSRLSPNFLERIRNFASLRGVVEPIKVEPRAG
ncbi:MAG: HD domain-containing phosphohydrolase [Gemmatimonadota bacterium]